MEISKNDFEEEKPKKIFNYDLEKIYFKILGKDYISYKFNKIVLGTKRLISNNLHYNDFSKEYDDKTKIISFKYPHLEYFPLQKNLGLISLGKIKYSYDSTKRKVNSKAFPDLSTKSKTINQNILLKSNKKYDNNIILNKIKLNYQDNNDIKENDKEINIYNSKSAKKMVGNKDFSNIINKMSRTNKNDIKISNNDSSIRSISTYTDKKKNVSAINYNLNNLNIRKRILFKNGFLKSFNFKRYIHNNRILLRDSLLNEKEYFKLKYDEDKIFLQTEHYNNFIKNHLNFIRTNNLKVENQGKLEKIYNKSKFKNTKLILKPIIIEFTKLFSFKNKNIDNSQEKQIFEIPFEYIPIFYDSSLTKIKEILTSIFYLNKDFTEFNINYKNFIYLINHSSIFNDSSKSNPQVFSRSGSKKTFTSKVKNFQSLSLSKSTSGKIKKRISVNPKKEVFEIIDIYNNNYNHISFNNNEGRNINNYRNKSDISSVDVNSNKIYFSNKNSFEYIWLTPLYEYLVNIKTPEISFYINDIIINKIIDIELLFFLMENNFQDWHFYVMEYLFSFYKFSLIINNFLSIYKINKYNFRNNLILKNKIINLSEEKKLKYSRKNYNFEYIFTDEKLNNHIKIFNGYKITIYNKKISKNHHFCFHMNFIQMKSLYFSIKKQGEKNLIEKILLLDKDKMKIKLNYDFLDNFCKNDLNNLEDLTKYNEENVPESEDNKSNFNINGNKITLTYPNLESIKFINNANQEDCFEKDLVNDLNNKITMDIIEKILKTGDLFIWPKIIEFDKMKKKKSNNRQKDLGNSLLLNKTNDTFKSVIIKKKKSIRFNEFKEIEEE